MASLLINHLKRHRRGKVRLWIYLVLRDYTETPFMWNEFSKTAQFLKLVQSVEKFRGAVRLVVKYQYSQEWYVAFTHDVFDSEADKESSESPMIQLIREIK